MLKSFEPVLLGPSEPPNSRANVCVCFLHVPNDRSVSILRHNLERNPAWRSRASRMISPVQTWARKFTELQSCTAWGSLLIFFLFSSNLLLSSSYLRSILLDSETCNMCFGLFQNHYPHIQALSCAISHLCSLKPRQIPKVDPAARKRAPLENF